MSLNNKIILVLQKGRHISCSACTFGPLAEKNSQTICFEVCIYTVGYKKGANFFVCNFVKNQQILMQFSLLHLQMNDTCDSINFTHLT